MKRRRQKNRNKGDGREGERERGREGERERGREGERERGREGERERRREGEKERGREIIRKVPYVDEKLHWPKRNNAWQILLYLYTLRPFKIEHDTLIFPSGMFDLK